DLGSELDFLDRDRGLVFPSELGLLLLLVLVLRVVHHPADGRLRVGRHLDQVEVLVPCVLERLVSALDADLLPVCADQAHLRDGDCVVDSGGRLLWPLVESSPRSQEVCPVTVSVKLGVSLRRTKKRAPPSTRLTLPLGKRPSNLLG